MNAFKRATEAEKLKKSRIAKTQKEGLKVLEWCLAKAKYVEPYDMGIGSAFRGKLPIDMRKSLGNFSREILNNSQALSWHEQVQDDYYYCLLTWGINKDGSYSVNFSMSKEELADHPRVEEDIKKQTRWFEVADIFA